MFSALSTTEASRFGKELAEFLLAELGASLRQTDAKFAGKVTKVLLGADRRVADFKAAHKTNFYQRAKLSNAFLWTLKDGGCSEQYATQLTEWLAMRL